MLHGIAIEAAFEELLLEEATMLIDAMVRESDILK
jgi:hypothetical protein